MLVKLTNDFELFVIFGLFIKEIGVVPMIKKNETYQDVTSNKWSLLLINVMNSPLLSSPTDLRL